MRAYREDGFPITIVRPSLTYGDTQVPLVVNSWQLPYTAIARMRAGKPIIVPGDGTSLWTMTHNTDLAKDSVLVSLLYSLIPVALVILLLVPVGGRLWCTMCPIPAPGEWLQRRALVQPRAGAPPARGPAPAPAGARGPARRRPARLTTESG